MLKSWAHLFISYVPVTCSIVKGRLVTFLIGVVHNACHISVFLNGRSDFLFLGLVTILSFLGVGHIFVLLFRFSHMFVFLKGWSHCFLSEVQVTLLIRVVHNACHTSVF